MSSSITSANKICVWKVRDWLCLFWSRIECLTSIGYNILECFWQKLSHELHDDVLKNEKIRTNLRHKWTVKERKTICSLTRTRSEEINISVVNFRSRLTFVEVCDVSKKYNSKDHYWLHEILYIVKIMKIGPNSIQI